MAENDSQRLPSFASLDELVEFVDTHDMGEYEEDLPEVQFEVNIQRRTHLVAIDEETNNRLTEIAQRENTRAESLVNSWLKEKVAPIQIKVTSADRGPVVSVLHGGLDFGEVVVTHQEYAVKGLVPLTILITAPAIFCLNKFVLEPLVGPIAERWKKAVAGYFSPIQPFNLTVEVTEEHLVLDASIETSHHITADIWSIVQQALEVLRMESRLSGPCRVRFIEAKSGKLLIFSYEHDNLPRVVDIERRQTTKVPEDLMAEASTSSLSPEEWLKNQTLKADRYSEYIANSRRGGEKSP